MSCLFWVRDTMALQSKRLAQARVLSHWLV